MLGGQLQHYLVLVGPLFESTVKTSILGRSRFDLHLLGFALCTMRLPVTITALLILV